VSIKKISISNFRCFDGIDIEFSKLNNFIHGANGSGKTSVLEALYFCSTGRSFKSSNKNLCIQSDKEAFKIQVDTFENNKICVLKEAKRSISLEINESKATFNRVI
jgi:DNA replication and repair protein RecF